MLGGSMGFSSNERAIDADIYRTALSSAKKNFSPEFFNRIDRTIVFRSLKSREMERILDIEVASIQDRVFKNHLSADFVIHLSSSARRFLLEEGASQAYGARHLKRAVKRHLTSPLSALLSAHQIPNLSSVTVHKNRSGKGLAFDAEALQPPGGDARSV